MGYRIKGVSGFGFGLSWEKSGSDKDVAIRVIRFFEDRRLLYGIRSQEDDRHCIESALQSRQFLTERLSTSGIGADLTASLKAIRTAMRRFVDQAGPHGRNFHHYNNSYEIDPFSLALGELRGTVCLHLANLAYQYGIEVEDDLAAVLPRSEDNDASWLPGFDK